MTDIIRHDTNTRMSQIVEYGPTIYLAGQVGTAGASVAQQTQDCLDKVDALLAQVGSDRSRILQTTIWLADMADFAEMNAGLGCLGAGRPCPGPGLRRIQAGHARIPCRSHCGGSKSLTLTGGAGPSWACPRPPFAR